MRLRPRTWAKLTVGVLVIGGTFALLWAAFRPSVDSTVEVRPPPRPPPLHGTHAVVLLRRAGSQRLFRATIACDGARRSARGFWAATPGVACDALASTRSALLAGPGCRRTLPTRDRLHVLGAFGPRRFDHRQQLGGCPDPRDWLAVDALGTPVFAPQRQATDRPR
jgi:hypothetical protein